MKLLFTFLVFVGVVSSAGAQWKQCGPRGENIRTLAGVGNKVFASGIEGIYKSEVGSSEWQMTDIPFTNVDKIESNGTILFATASQKGMYRSFDSGNSWEPSKDTMISRSSISILSVDDSILLGYDSQAKRLYRSANNGDMWEIIPIGFDGFIVSLKSMGNVVFVGTESKGIYRSTDFGVTWTSMNAGISSKYAVNCFASIGDTLFTTVEYGGVFRSVDAGEHWAAVNTGLQYNNSTNIVSVKSLLFANSQIYAVAEGGYNVFRSIDNGDHWIQEDWGMICNSIGVLRYINNILYAGTKGGGIYRSTDVGRNWSDINSGFPYLHILSLASKGDTLFAGTRYGGIYRSYDKGESWREINIGVKYPQINSIAVNGSTIFAGTQHQGVLRSDDNGDHWILCDSMMLTAPITQIIVGNSTVFVGTDGSGVYQSYDNGLHWVRDTSYTKGQHVVSLALKDTSLFVGTNDNQIGLVRNYFNHGIGKSRFLGFCCSEFPIAVSGPNVLLGAHDGNTQVLQISKDDGITWTKTTASFRDNYLNKIYANGNIVFAHVVKTVYQSYDNGYHFIFVDTLPEIIVNQLELSGSTLYVATSNGIRKRPISMTDVQEETSTTSAPHLSIYPNPTTTSITIDRASLPFTIGAVNYTILSVTGEKVYDVEQSETRFTLSVDGLPSGVYSLVARQGLVRSAGVFTVVR